MSGPLFRVASAGRLVVALAIMLPLSGCSVLGPGRVTVGASPYTDGSGVKTTVQRAIGTYHAIAASSGVTVVVNVGTPGVASVTADDNLIGQIVTKVRDGTLYVGVEGGVRSANPLRVDLASADLDAVTASAGATVEAASLTGSSLAIEALAGGTVRAAGRADSLRVTSSAGGTADVRDLQATNVEVQITAGGTAQVYPTDSVTGACTGGATLLVRGKPAHNSVSVDVSSSVKDGQ
jgi:hypothetical protein